MISDRFKTVRKTAGYTQKEFAKILNSTQPCISDYEKAKNQIPDSIKEKLYKLGFNINWLITGEGNMKLNEMHTETKLDEIDKLKDLHKLYSEGIIDDKDMKILKNRIIYP